MIFIINKLFSDEKGAVAIFIALFMTVLIGFTALAIDVGRIKIEKQSLQDAVDAACLAAVVKLPNTTDSTKVAKKYIVDNDYEELNIQKLEFLNGNRKIRIIAAAPIDYTFAKIFNIGSYGTVKVIAAAEITNPLSPLDYAVFSGNELKLQFEGSSTTISGDVHSNGDIKGTVEITGEVTYCSTTDGKQDATEGLKKLTNTLTMPDFSGLLKELPTVKYYNEEKLDGYVLTYSSAQINSDLATNNVIYVYGDVEINGTGVNASAGTIIATGNIKFNGSGVNVESPYPICLYSLNGDITFDGSGATLTGLLYAPNGSVTFNGSDLTLYGRVYGHDVDIRNKSKIISSADDLSAIPIKVYRLVE